MFVEQQMDSEGISKSIQFLKVYTEKNKNDNLSYDVEQEKKKMDAWFDLIQYRMTQSHPEKKDSISDFIRNKKEIQLIIIYQIKEIDTLINQFLSQIETNQYDQAYQFMTKDYQSTFVLNRFVDQVNKIKIRYVKLSRIKVQGYSLKENKKKETTCTMTYKMTYEKEKITGRFSLIKLDKIWKLSEFEIPYIESSEEE